VPHVSGQDKPPGRASPPGQLKGRQGPFVLDVLVRILARFQGFSELSGAILLPCLSGFDTGATVRTIEMGSPIQRDPMDWNTRTSSRRG